MAHPFKSVIGAAVISLLGLCPAVAQAPSAAKASWIVPDLLAAAKAEGALTVYGSMNEREALPLWKQFEDATGIKVSYVRGSDTALLGRIAIESRARQRTWDVVVTTPVNRIPNTVLLQFDPPQAKGLMPQARDPNRRWYGVYANYNVPAYNTKFVKKSDLPKTYEDFLKHKEWAGKVAIDRNDSEWLSAMAAHYGEAKAKQLVKDIVATLKPVLTDGHLAMARAVGAGEYWIALNNYLNLTLNTKMSGAATDFWALDPVALIFGSVGVSAQAPHPKAAQLAANFVVSREGQQFMTKRGRLPTRPDVTSNPPGVLDPLQQKKIIPAVLSTAEEKKWQAEFNELFKAR